MEYSSAEFKDKVRELENQLVNPTARDQVDRLTKPGASFLNLNPYEVLKISDDLKIDEIKKRFRKLSILVHPDKNPDNLERAKRAFEAVSFAMKTLEVPEQVGKLRLIMDEAKGLLEVKLRELRKEAREQGISTIDEDKDPEKYFKLKRATACKLFADYELKRQELQTTGAHDRKRNREREIEQEEYLKFQLEWEKMWEDARPKRVESWRNFRDGVKRKKHVIKTLKPPSVVPEKKRT